MIYKLIVSKFDLDIGQIVDFNFFKISQQHEVLKYFQFNKF